MSRLPVICLWFQREKETGGENNTYVYEYILRLALPKHLASKIFDS